LLNIGDGFLGEHLKLHILATTNVPIQKLDAALLRPGRLIAVRQFRRLSHTEATRLCCAKGLDLPRQEDFSLAEL
jgi:ATP-dependent 26S proteasome regulatory subunit